ncbi:MAG: lysine biosynthesis protein LysW [Candidatus Verstraetearchaeota archaeon]|nr:lysine biosynthesis protein LysW [Candidatus Verstraetearchaeota archaeon]
MKFTCPECGAEIEAEDVIEGEILTCPDCGVELEVVLEGDSYSLKPAEKEAEDWGE